MPDNLADIKFWSNVIIGAIALFFTGWIFAWIKDLWVCRNDKWMRTAIDVTNYSFEKINYDMERGKKCLRVCFINEETEGTMVITCSPDLGIIKNECYTKEGRVCFSNEEL